MSVLAIDIIAFKFTIRSRRGLCSTSNSPSSSSSRPPRVSGCPTRLCLKYILWPYCSRAKVAAAAAAADTWAWRSFVRARALSWNNTPFIIRRNETATRGSSLRCWAESGAEHVMENNYVSNVFLGAMCVCRYDYGAGAREMPE